MAICQDPLDPKESKLQKPRRSGADADVFNYLRSQIVKLCFLEPKLWSCKQLITMNTTKCVPYQDNKKGHLGVRLLWVVHEYFKLCLMLPIHVFTLVAVGPSSVRGKPHPQPLGRPVPSVLHARCKWCNPGLGMLRG